MSLFKIFDVSASALSAQSVRLNTIASNMQNAEVASSSPDDVYKARRPVFQTFMDQVGNEAVAKVRVTDIVEINAEPQIRIEPNHPLANENGEVFYPAVNQIEEITDMISAESSYRSSVELMSTVKQLMLRTLQIGRS